MKRLMYLATAAVVFMMILVPVALAQQDMAAGIDWVGAIPEDNPCRNIEDLDARIRCQLSQDDRGDITLKCMLALQMQMNLISQGVDVMSAGEQARNYYELNPGDCSFD